MSRNNELYQACKAWLEVVLQQLTPLPVPYKRDLQVNFHNNGYSMQDILKVNTTQVYFQYRNMLSSLPEYKHILDIVTKLPELTSVLCADATGKVPSELEQQRVLLERYFATLLTEYLHLREQSDFGFSVDVYNQIYGALERYIYSTEPFDGIWSVYLRNAVTELDSIHIDDTISLRPASHEEKVDSLRKDPQVQISPGLQIAPDIPSVFLDIHKPVPKVITTPFFPDPGEATFIAERIVFALRLLKQEKVSIASYRWHIPEQPFAYQSEERTYLTMPHHFGDPGETYQLTQEDADVLPKLWLKATKVYDKTELSTVITRYEDSYMRTKPQDKLIDYWTALEALFFLEDEFQDMGKSLALAASYYLGCSSSDRRTIYNDLTRSHTLRSHYIHGERKQTKYSLDEMVTKTGNHLRNALRKRIEE